MPHITKPDFDAVVIGAGVTGIYQTYLLDQNGMSVLGVDAAEDVGGTWYWNRYPGCRLDTESYAYGYFALKGIIPDWTWSETFAGQPEMLRYVNAAADKMDIRRPTSSRRRLCRRFIMTRADGTVVRRTLVYVGGGPEYRKRCEEVAYNDYQGFELS